MSSVARVSSWMRLVADTGMIASQSRSSDTASSCAATAGRDAASIFVTIATFLARGNESSCSLMYRSPGPIFSLAGMQNPTTSTSPSVDCTMLLRRSPRRVRGRCMPGVSTRISWPFFWCAMPRMARRVVCGLDDVMATFSPTSALVSVDLPTFGRPTNDTKPALNSAGAWGSFATVVSIAWFAERGLRVDEGLIALDEHGAEPLATAFRALGGKDESRIRGDRAGQGQTPERLRKQTADRVDVVVVEVDREQLAEFVHRQSRAHPEYAVLELLHLDDLAVVFVRNVANEFLDEVFERHEPGDPAVLVHNHREVVRFELHLAQGVVGLLRFRDEERGAHEVGDREQVHAERPLVTQPGHVPQVEDPAHLVHVLAHHGHAGDAFAQEDSHRGAEVLGVVDRDHVRARDHDLAHDSVVEFEDRVDELAVVLLEHLVFRGLIHHAQQLFLGGEARAPTGRDAIAHRHEGRCDRSEGHADGVHDPRRPARDRAGMHSSHAPRA